MARTSRRCPLLPNNTGQPAASVLQGGASGKLTPSPRRVGPPGVAAVVTARRAERKSRFHALIAVLMPCLAVDAVIEKCEDVFEDKDDKASAELLVLILLALVLGQTGFNPSHRYFASCRFFSRHPKMDRTARMAESKPHIVRSEKPPA
jgi:hypothetical protein